MGFVSQYVKAQFKQKLVHPLRHIFCFVAPILFFVPCIFIARNWKREGPARIIKPETNGYTHYSTLMTIATLTFYLLYTFTTAYDVVRERQTLRKQTMLANGLGKLKFYWAWLVYYGILIFPTSVLICAVVWYLNVFPTVNIFVIFVDFYLFQLSGVTVAFWVATYVPIPIIASIVVTFFNMSWTGAYFGMVMIPRATKEILCLFVSPITAGSIIDNFQIASIRGDAINLINLVPFLGGKYSVFAHTFKLIFNNILYVTFGILFEKLFQHLTRNKGELKMKGYYESEAKNNSTTFESKKRGVTRIAVENAFKTYFAKGSKVDAISNVSFEAYKNEVLAIAGKQGSGKSTLIKLLAGRTLPSYGNVEILSAYGKDQIGVMTTVGSVAPADDSTVFNNTSVENNIEIYKAIVNNGQNGNDLLNQLNFAGKKSDVYRKLNEVEKNKVKAAIAFLCDREVVLLDEPTAGMTEKDKEAFWKLAQSKKNGKTIIVSTESLSEAEEFADRVLVLENGKIECIGEVEYVKENSNVRSELQVKVEC